MRRRVFVLVVLVLFLALEGYWWFWPRGSTRISRQEVVGVRFQPVPEGPTAGFGQGFPQDKSLRLVERYIPNPLPAPLRQAPWCSSGEDLVITLKNGQDLSYGPCRRPASIDALIEAMDRVL